MCLRSISAFNKALLWGKTHSDWLGLAPKWVGIYPPRSTHGGAHAQSCEIHCWGSNEFISIDWFPYMYCNIVNSLILLHVAFIFMFSKRVVDTQMAYQMSEIISRNLKVAMLYGPVWRISKTNDYGGSNCAGSRLFEVITHNTLICATEPAQTAKNNRCLHATVSHLKSTYPRHFVLVSHNRDTSFFGLL